jgi:hypothetical protein
MLREKTMLTITLVSSVNSYSVFKRLVMPGIEGIGILSFIDELVVVKLPPNISVYPYQ